MFIFKVLLSLLEANREEKSCLCKDESSRFLLMGKGLVPLITFLWVQTCKMQTSEENSILQFRVTVYLRLAFSITPEHPEGRKCGLERPKASETLWWDFPPV